METPTSGFVVISLLHDGTHEPTLTDHVNRDRPLIESRVEDVNNGMTPYVSSNALMSDGGGGTSH